MGPASRRLARRLLAMGEDRLSRLEAIAGAGAHAQTSSLLIVLGAGDDLPWAEGVAYLGRAPTAPRLLVSTTHAPSVPEDLFEEALHGRFGVRGLAVIHAANLVVSLADAGPIEPALLKQWCEGQA